MYTDDKDKIFSWSPSHPSINSLSFRMLFWGELCYLAQQDSLELADTPRLLIVQTK